MTASGEKKVRSFIAIPVPSEGIRALEAHAAMANQEEPVTVNVDLFVFQR